MTAWNFERRPIVLVVEDEPMIADSLAKILNLNGYDATAAYDAESALEKMLNNAPDLLISDIALPKMNGIDLAIQIKKLIPDCKVMLFTGQHDIDHLLALAHIAKYDFGVLHKPISAPDLLKHLAIALGT
jgi:DNA-binding NtrC family response regulator